MLTHAFGLKVIEDQKRNSPKGSDLACGKNSLSTYEIDVFVKSSICPNFYVDN